MGLTVRPGKGFGSNTWQTQTMNPKTFEFYSTLPGSKHGSSLCSSALLSWLKSSVRELAQTQFCDRWTVHWLLPTEKKTAHQHVEWNTSTDLLWQSTSAWECSHHGLSGWRNLPLEPCRKDGTQPHSPDQSEHQRHLHKNIQDHFTDSKNEDSHTCSRTNRECRASVSKNGIPSKLSRIIQFIVQSDDTTNS